MIVFDGKQFAREREEKLRQQWQKKPSKIHRKQLVDVLVGDDPAARTYVSLKKQAAQRVGIKFRSIVRKIATTPELLNLIEQLNKAEKVGGFLFQLPLPGRLRKDQSTIINSIAPGKDVDCLTSRNLGLLLEGETDILPATVTAVTLILVEAGFPPETLAGERVVVLGSSTIVGQPLANWLINQGATVTVAHKKTQNLAALTRQAKIVISATGQPNLVTDDMITPGTVIVDVGAPRADVDYEAVAPKVSFITPVPGGVGPVTVVSLLENFVSLLDLNEKLG